MNGRGISWSQVRVGLAVILALGLLGTAVFFIGETGAIFGNRYGLVTMMRSANGLIEGAGVRLAGQDVGKVDAIEFVPITQRARPDQVLRVRLAIDRRVQDQIRTDSEARLRTQGLLGDKVVDITPGSAGAEILEPGDTLAAGQAIDYEQMLGSASLLIDDLAAILNNFRLIADTIIAGQGTVGRLLTDTTLYAELLRTSRSMTRFLDAVSAEDGALTRLASDDRLYRDLRSSIAGLDSLTTVLLDGEGTLSRLLKDETLYLQLARSSARADSLLAALESGDGTLGRLMTDQEMYEALLKLVVDMQTLVRELQETPRKYIPPIRVF